VPGAALALNLLNNRSSVDGPMATITMPESAFRILNVINQLAMEDSGTFIDF